MLTYALAVFSGAFLLFQVQPLLGKYILPWFGGGPGVWTTCILFFQVMLLGGYAWAHLNSRLFRLRTQTIIHLALILIALACLPVIPAEKWKPTGSANPSLQILLLLLATIGLPYFVLSATGPLVQHWFSRTHPDKSPYRLYALSNIGSLLALLSYPFYFESHFSRKEQAFMWGAGLTVYGVACAICAVAVWKRRSATAQESSPLSPPQPSVAQGSSTAAAKLLWFLLPACASILLLAITNKMCLDVAAIPFLWVLPLALYLLSFVLCFDHPRWYLRFPFTLGLVAASVLLIWALVEGSSVPTLKQLGIYSAALFVCCMVCHGELYRLRPGPERLTSYYLAISVGGALGGLFVAVLAPLWFKDYFELHAGLLLCGVLLLFVWLADSSASPRFWKAVACALPILAFAGLDYSLAGLAHRVTVLPASYAITVRILMWILMLALVISWVARGKYRAFVYWRPLACAWLTLGCVALGATLWSLSVKSSANAVRRLRNFYGVLTVYERRKTEPADHHYVLQHGQVTHGLQFVRPDKQRIPTSYYGDETGISLAFNALPDSPRRIGIIGLGTGTLTLFGRKGDYLRIYEINPQVLDVAQHNFTYLRDCKSKVEVVMGDARLSMENEPPQQFDLLALDAFSSDSIPVHLLTREAFEIYQRHVKPGGIIVFHTSNHYLDLEPVVVNLARSFQYEPAIIDFYEMDPEWWLYSSTWILVTRNESLLDHGGIRDLARSLGPAATRAPLWTDDFASMARILK